MSSQVGRFLKKENEWALIFRHYSGNGQYFSNSSDWAEAKFTNPGNPLAEKYSILSELEHFNIGNKFTLKLHYPTTGTTNIWSQTNNPVIGDGSGGVTGYTAIDIDSTSSGWGGLERYDSQTSTFLDGTLSPQGNWWWAVGSRSSYGTNLYPGPGVAVNECELWVKFR